MISGYFLNVTRFFGLPERLDMGMYNDVASVTIP